MGQRHFVQLDGVQLELFLCIRHSTSGCIGFADFNGFKLVHLFGCTAVVHSHTNCTRQNLDSTLDLTNSTTKYSLVPSLLTIHFVITNDRL